MKINSISKPDVYKEVSAKEACLILQDIESCWENIVVTIKIEQKGKED